VSRQIGSFHCWYDAKIEKAHSYERNTKPCMCVLLCVIKSAHVIVSTLGDLKLPSVMTMLLWFL